MGDVCFHIVSKMHGKVLDVEGGDPQPGTRVICWPKKDPVSPNQLWMLEKNADGSYHIVSCLDNNVVMDVKGNGPAGTEVIVWNRDYGLAPNQCFRFDNGCLVSGSGLALDIAEENKDDGAHIVGWDTTHNRNQLWQLVSHP